MFGVPDDDDLDFSPAAGSKLASLFGLGKSSDKGNSSLTYTAPKQPKHRGLSDSASQSAGSGTTARHSDKLSLIVVKPVHAFKLEDGNYNAQGKMGAALLGNASLHIYQLLLYKGKDMHITKVRILSNFQYTVQPNLYATFYDDSSKNWSIAFENKEDSIDFARQVGVARYRSAAGTEEVAMYQELFPGEGEKAHEGEMIGISVTALPFKTDLAQAVDAQQYVSEADMQYVIPDVGWGAGLLGAMPGSQRLLLLPEMVEIPWFKRQRNSPLLVEVTVKIRKKIESNEGSISKEILEERGAVSVGGGDSAVDSSADDSSIRARGASIKEALTSSPRSNKASIISRMARMGQATLPLKGAIACNPSDSEETEDEPHKPPNKARPSKVRSATATQRHQVPVTNASAVPHSSSSSPAAPEFTSQSPAVTVIQTPSTWGQQNILRGVGQDGSVIQYMGTEGQLVPIGSQQHQLQYITSQSPVTSPADPSPHISMFLSEARMNNSEMRMNMSKFGDKLDQLMAKVDSLGVAGAGASQSPVSYPTVGLEPHTLLSSIEKLVKDNQSLQTEVAEKNKRLDEQNERIFSLLSVNSKFLEQSSSLIEQRQQQKSQQEEQDRQHQQNEELMVQLQQLQVEKSNLADQLASSQTQLASLQSLVQEAQRNNAELTQELNQLQAKEKSLREAEAKMQDSEEAENQKLKAILAEKEVLISSLKQDLDSKENKHSSDLAAAKKQLEVLEQRQKEDVSSLRDQLYQYQTSSVDPTFISNLQTENSELKKLNDKLKEESQSKVTNLPPQGAELSLGHFTSEMKALMNTLYRGLNQQFAAGQSYDGAEIKAVIGGTIKREALALLEKIEKLQTSANNPGTEFSSNVTEQPKESSAIPTVPTDVPASTREESKVIAQVAAQKIALSPEGDSEPQTKPVHQPVLPSSNPPPQVSSGNSQVSQVTSNGSITSVVTSKEQDYSFDSDRSWRPQPPPPPLFLDEDDSDDWLT